MKFTGDIFGYFKRLSDKLLLKNTQRRNTMANDYYVSSTHVKEYIFNLQIMIFDILHDDLAGIYIHGSLALGGFNPKSSDIDLLAVTKKAMTAAAKRKLAKLFLEWSNSPFPVEISFLNMNQLKVWKHPCTYDFHYSEFWRERYANELLSGSNKYLNDHVHYDADLAAHIMITKHSGICVYGQSIDEIFPNVPPADYLSSIMSDFKDCLENILIAPIYCTLNLIRVYWYIKEGVISSKQAAGEWGFSTFPQEMRNTIKRVTESYSMDQDAYCFEEDELLLIKSYIFEEVKKVLN